MSVSVFTVTHVPFTPPADPVYVPLQAGRALHEDLGYTGDDSGDNISAKNPLYGELTALYWIRHNRSGCADYLGLCHYRRFFLNDAGEPMRGDEYERILSACDVMIAEPQTGDLDYRTVYGRSHDIRHLDLAQEVIVELCPDYLEDFRAVTASHSCYVGNLFVAPSALFCAYCDWLFPIFAAMEDRIDTSGLDEYHRRLFGFLSEQLLMVWIRHNRLSYRAVPIGLSREKAETTALKAALRHDLQAGDADGAYRRLCDTLDRRPDLLLDASDFGGELRTVEHILNACRVEQESGLPTLLSFSGDMEVLIGHFRLLTQIASHIALDAASAEEVQYLWDSRVSPKAILYILQNLSALTGEALRAPSAVLNRLARLCLHHGDPTAALFYLEAALEICETDAAALRNAAAAFTALGDLETAAEYTALLRQAAPPDRPLRIVVFTGSEIAILQYLSECYAQAFTELGHTVLRFDRLRWEESLLQLLQWLQDGVDAAFLFNNRGFAMPYRNTSLWDLYHVPVVNQLVDHPMFYRDTMDHAPACGVVACADRLHTDYIRRFCPAVRRTVFLPTAGACRKPYAALKPYAERPIDLLFIGSYKYDRETAEQEDDIGRYLLAELCAHPGLTLSQAAEAMLEASGLRWSDPQTAAFVESKRHLEIQAASWYRGRIIEALVRDGVTVTVYGEGWEALGLDNFSNFVRRPPCPPEDGVALMEEARIVLNQLTWFKAGASERVFEAMLQGAVCLTDDSAYLREQFTDGEEIRFFSLEHLDQLPALAQELLADDALAERIRHNAYEKAAAEHTWQARARELLDYLF